MHADVLIPHEAMKCLWVWHIELNQCRGFFDNYIELQIEYSRA